MPIVSVVIPCYNAGAYIEKCLCALDGQTFQDFDVIVVDDCSTDNSGEVVSRFRDTHALKITYLRGEVNCGPGKSRNTGISYSTAEYVAFCDSDDWYEADYLERMVAKARENDADMVFCNSKRVFPDGRQMNIDLLSACSNNPTAKEVLTMGIDSLCCLMVRREIARNAPMPHILNGEDMAVIPLMIMQSRRFGIVREYLYNYLCRPGSLSLSASEKAVKSLVFSFTHIMQHQQAGYEREVEFIGIKNVVYGVLLNHFKHSKDKKTAKKILQDFENNYPAWRKNPHIGTLPLYKKVFVRLAGAHCFAGVKILCYVHKRLTKSGN